MKTKKLEKVLRYYFNHRDSYVLRRFPIIAAACSLQLFAFLGQEDRLDTFYGLPDSSESMNKGQYKSVQICLTTNGVFFLLYCLQHESVPKAPHLPWDLYPGDLSRSPKSRTFVFMTFVTCELVYGQGRVN